MVVVGAVPEEVIVVWVGGAVEDQHLVLADDVVVVVVVNLDLVEIIDLDPDLGLEVHRELDADDRDLAINRLTPSG